MHKTIENIEVYRPIQYLGTKVRSLPHILKAMEELHLDSHSTCLDLFAGSSVVSQALKISGYRVIANDALKFSSILCEALIGNVIFSGGKELLSKFDDIEVNEFTIGSAFSREIDKEMSALVNSDYKTLISQNFEVLSRWDNCGKDYLNKYADNIKDENIASILYAGTYFGYKQSSDIDNIRKKIIKLEELGVITNFEQAVLNSALLSASSKAVFSAGKHFAQPHLIKEDKNIDFISKRIIIDRSINVLRIFRECVEEILAWRNIYGSNDSVSINSSFEDLNGKPEVKDVDVIYVDPPYTAQQYSRFYHIPEVLIGKRFPELQYVNGSLTRGLYPQTRHKSRFCSKIASKEAFEEVFKMAELLGASLVISYSYSQKSVTGNQRMISLNEITRLAEKYYGKGVSVMEFDHVYRQFNSSALIVSDKSDVEVQIVCKK